MEICDLGFMIYDLSDAVRISCRWTFSLNHQS